MSTKKTADPQPDPEAIRDTLLRTIDIRAKALESLALRADANGVIGMTEGENPRPIQFPAYEVQAYMAAVSGVTESEIRHLQQLGKLKPEELDAAVSARERLAKASRGGE